MVLFDPAQIAQFPNSTSSLLNLTFADQPGSEIKRQSLELYTVMYQ